MTNVLDQIKPQIEAASETGFEVAKIALSQIERASKHALELSKQNQEFAQIQLGSISDIKDPTQVFQFVQHQLEATAKYAAEVAKEFHELNQEFQTELGDFANSHFDAKHGEFNKFIATSLKQAPEGSEVFVSFVKQAVDAGNNAVEQARNSTKVATKLVNDTFEQVKKAAPAKSTTRSSRAAK
jgi:hypothetical protein